MKKKAPDNKTELFKCGALPTFTIATLRARKSIGSDIKKAATPSTSFEIPDLGGSGFPFVLINFGHFDP
jgi:hypothetical protein